MTPPATPPPRPRWFTEQPVVQPPNALRDPVRGRQPVRGRICCCRRRTSAGRRRASRRIRPPGGSPCSAAIASSSSSRLTVLAGPPPMLNAWPATLRQVPLGEQQRVDEVVDEQQVAHLLAVAIDRDRQALQRADQEMRDPALVLGAVLVRPVDAAHAEHRGRAGRSCGRSRARTDRRHPSSSRRGCGTASGRVSAMPVRRARPPARSGWPRSASHVVDRAIDLVGRGEDQPRPAPPRRRSVSSSSRVPAALTAKSSAGSSRLVVTATCAAR